MLIVKLYQTIILLLVCCTLFLTGCKQNENHVLSKQNGDSSSHQLGVGITITYACTGGTFGDPLFPPSTPLPVGETQILGSPNPAIDCSSVNKVEVYCRPVSNYVQDTLMKGYSVDLKNTAQQTAAVTITIDKDGMLQLNRATVTYEIDKDHKLQEITTQGKSLGEKINVRDYCK